MAGNADFGVRALRDCGCRPVNDGVDADEGVDEAEVKAPGPTDSQRSLAFVSPTYIAM